MNNLSQTAASKARSYLTTICAAGPDRRTGSAGGRKATEFFIAKVSEWGYDVDATPFECMDFKTEVSSLLHGKSPFQVFASPFSTGCKVTAGMVIASTVAELKKCSCKGKILLLKGEVCAEHLMPKNYPFYNPDHHKAIIALLEQKQPAAIIAATAKNPALMGAVYPFPLIEDADFNIPSAYCTDATGEMIASDVDGEFRLAIDAKRYSAKACNVVARKNPGARNKIVVCAHLDSRPETPGALDNGAGSATLLLLAEMLKDYKGSTGIEIVAINTEEHYSAAGELDYLRRYGKELDRVAFAVNLDSPGYMKGKTAFSLYECPAAIAKKARLEFGGFDSMVEGPQWPAGDHMVFVMNGRPAIAITSEKAAALGMDVLHTSEDIPVLVDCGKLVDVATALKELIEKS
jgi:aminopeptidase YwaD